ncbi:hypothetical protein EDC44_102144 [Cricetibacter osteomyelitidis]|uniref:Outer membrane protein n=1 Tax=Cricetibacter osteomyelitidis TaxID=1521931 RepID=A0A4R2T4P6_9PAST|nr:hypothetical protein [Cricetibacter osteomyelitidis]TCP97340.1 hypothetical protein EDC44_102144 [Cricetibacter osteomyelitidis]
MNLLKTLFVGALALISVTAFAENFNIKYSSNYLMPAYINFNIDNGQYFVESKINVPLYNIRFLAKGYMRNNQFNMLNYSDTRNGKAYATAKIDMNNITYGKVKDQKTETFTLPTMDLFTMAFQLSYYDQLPTSFQITNGKKLYPMENVKIQKSQKAVERDNGQSVQEITYKFKTGNKDIMVKKHANEKFPRYISYSRDGDEYELTFDSFVK